MGWILALLLVLLEPEFRRSCATLELIAPREYCPLPELWIAARQNYRELRDAPCLAQAGLLPDHSVCVRNVWLLEQRICAIERQRGLFGSYRHEDFEPALLSLRACLAYWKDCEIATGTDKWRDRRLALQRIRDN